MTEENNVSNWFQDNLRIIISVGIVILLVFAIYSYSQRNSRTTDAVVDDSTIEEVATADDIQGDEINEIIDEIRDEEIAEEAPIEVIEETAKEEEQPEEAVAEEVVEEVAEEEKPSEEPATENRSAEDVVREVIESRSQQKSGVVTVVAVRGDSATTLARKATAEFISKNNTTGITAAHKVYIEDYLRKAKNAGGIHPGTEIEFTNNMISEAIAKSQNLNQAQINNLSRYAQNVSNL